MDPRKYVDPSYARKEASAETLMQSHMYTPELLKSDNLATNCLRMVEFGLADPELLRRYGDRAAELSGGLTPSEFTRILTAFTRARSRHDDMFKAFAKTIPGRLPQFLPKHIGTTCHAFSTLREYDVAFFRRLSSEMPHKLPLFEPITLQIVVNSYAKLSIRDDLLFDDIADEVVRRPEEFDANTLAVLTTAFAHFQVRHERLWHTVCDWLLRSQYDMTGAECVFVLNALSQVGFHHDQLVEAMARAVSEPPLITQLEPKHLGIVLNALVRLRIEGEQYAEPLSALADRVVEVSEEIDVRGISMLLHACTKLQSLRHHEPIIECLLKRTRSHIADMGAQQLSMFVHALASLGRPDGPMLALVAKAVHPVVKDFTPQGLAMIARGYARLGARSEILFYLLAGEMVEKMPLFEGRGIIMVLQAFAKLEILNEKLLRAIRKQIRALYGELTLRELDAMERGFTALDALDATTEAMLRRQRRHVGERGEGDTEASAERLPETADPLDDATHLLRRLAEEPDEPVAPARPAAVSAEGPRAPDASRDTESADQAEDLWTLWGRDDTKSTPAGVAEDATPRARLREYLARPERAGRRPVVLQGEEVLAPPLGPAGPGLAEGDGDAMDEHQTDEAPAGGGRKRRRQQR